MQVFKMTLCLLHGSAIEHLGYCFEKLHIYLNIATTGKDVWFMKRQDNGQIVQNNIILKSKTYVR